ncbi:MAG: RluA family pseudouridine synthase [Treponemataceae bacterium]|nr:RluA family pseudouridine synthase [Treponemataceae bacterium]
MVKASAEYKRLHKPNSGREKIEILYEDAYLAVICKPEGMLSVPYPGSRARTALDALELVMRRRGTYSAGRRPFAVHRLDRETSGVMMFALTERAMRKIMDTWHQMVAERIYRAVAENPKPPAQPLPDAGLIDDEIAYNARNIGFVPRPGSTEFKTVPARTHFSVIVRGRRHTLFELSLDTGRKNQIRAHLAGRGCPLAGDENYRAQTDPFGRLALHARTLEFDHPFTGERLKFERPEPAEWREAVENAPRQAEQTDALSRRTSGGGGHPNAAAAPRRSGGKKRRRAPTDHTGRGMPSDWNSR